MAADESGESGFPVYGEKFIKKVCDCHQIEINYYEHLNKTLDIPVPYVFKTLPWKIGEAEGLIQMEDMTGKGKSFVMGTAVTIPQIKEMIRILAHMHSRVLASEDQEFLYWKGKHNGVMDDFGSMFRALNDPKTLLDICRDKGKSRISYLFLI